MASYDRALAIKPDYADALVHRAEALADLGRNADAVQAYRLALAHGGDASRIEYSLAALGAAARPKASPVEYVTALFDQYAEAFDAHLVETLHYRTPALLVGAVRARYGCQGDVALPLSLLPTEDGRLQPASGRLDALEVLDLGCGTGLCDAAEYRVEVADVDEHVGRDGEVEARAAAAEIFGHLGAHRAHRHAWRR